MSDSTSLPPKRKRKPGQSLFAKFLKHVVELDTATDDEGETYLDLKGVGFVSDKNSIAALKSRQGLWKDHPYLEGRLVILPFHQNLFNLSKNALNDGDLVCVTGTPGVGKSVLRTAHIHSFLRQARRAQQCCRIILGNGKQKLCTVLTLFSDGSTTVEELNVGTVMGNYRSVNDPNDEEEIDMQDNEEEIDTPDDEFVLGKNCFVLVDVSNGDLGDFSATPAGLVVYSSPNCDLNDTQMFKERMTVLAYPLVEKEFLLRYKDDEMEELFEKYGGLPRLVWGSRKEERRHVTHLTDSLQDIEAFLRITATENYLVGPHRFYYTDVKKDEEGEWIHDVDEQRPGVLPAPKHVMKIAAQKVVEHLLAPSAKAQFGLDHKTVSGVLFEEVCFHLLTNYRDRIKVDVKSLTKSRLLGTAKLVVNKVLVMNIGLTRKDVDASSLVDSMKTCKGGDLVVPKTSNFPGGVLVLGSHDDLDAWLYLQMTISLSHAVADTGVDMLSDLSSNAPRKNSKAKRREALCFVVPANNFNSFKEQGAKSQTQQGSLDKIAQYVMSISIVS